jgi:ATP-binding cassette subfamily B protein
MRSGVTIAANRLRARLLGSFAYSLPAMRLVGAVSPGGVVAIALLSAASALVPVGMAYIGKIIVDNVVIANGGDATRVSHVVWWVATEAALVALLGVLERASSVVTQSVGGKLAIHINLLILEKALTLDLQHFENPAIYDKITRARNEASSRPLSLLQQHLQVFRNTLSTLGYIGLLLRVSPWMVAALIIASIPAAIAEAKFSGAAYRLRQARSPERRRLAYLEFLATDDRHFKETKLFRLGRTLVERYRQGAESVHREELSLARKRSLWTYALSLAGVITFYLSYGLVAVTAASGGMTLGDMTLYVVAFRQSLQGVQAVLAAVGGMYEDNLYMSNLFEFLALPTTDRAVAIEPAADGERGIRFEDVSLRYPGSTTWAVRHLNLFIAHGQSLAIVGDNGAGKTTLVKLLSRLYDPTEGRILIDGRDLRDWPPEALSRRIAVIFQDFNRYQLRLRDNVGFGSVEHLDDVARVKRAMDRGGASSLASGLANGIDAQLGRWFPGGIELSGGEWQKIALSRAFMHEEAEVLILDEPTASLDARAEAEIFERFRALTVGRTSIVISHRFPTARIADRILVMSRGQIVEQGTHDELVALGGRYSELFSLQAAGYR